MTTKTVTIENPQDWQAGDRFQGTLIAGTQFADHELKVEGILYESYGYLTVSRTLPHVNMDWSEEYWNNVTVTREVEVLSKHLKFRPGAHVQFVETGDEYVLTGNGWVNIKTGNGDYSKATIDETIEDREVFKNSYRLVHGDEPEGRD